MSLPLSWKYRWHTNLDVVAASRYCFNLADLDFICGKNRVFLFQFRHLTWNLNWSRVYNLTLLRKSAFFEIMQKASLALHVSIFTYLGYSNINIEVFRINSHLEKLDYMHSSNESTWDIKPILLVLSWCLWSVPVFTDLAIRCSPLWLLAPEHSWVGCNFKIWVQLQLCLTCVMQVFLKR